MLTVGDSNKLHLLQPKLAEIYREHGSWDQIIAATMHFPEDMPASIRQMWIRNQEIAATNNLPLTAQQFAEMFVDQNLV